MTALSALVESEVSTPVDPRVARFAERIAAQYGSAARAVLFYGSCLRQSELDGLMLDFYLIVSEYQQAYRGKALAFLNWLIPPNVFPIEADGLVAKYAVLSERDFAKLASSRTCNVSVWARFAQPSRLVWTADEGARQSAIKAIAGAAPALLESVLPLFPAKPSDPLDLWRRGFALTYSAELRAETKARPDLVVDADAERYRAFSEPALQALPSRLPTAKRTERLWRRRRIEGKLLTVVRLLKASFTFAGGIDYLAWKVNRHAGTKIMLKPWQRRWPLIGALTLLPRLLARGAIR